MTGDRQADGPTSRRDDSYAGPGWRWLLPTTRYPYRSRRRWPTKILGGEARSTPSITRICVDSRLPKMILPAADESQVIPVPLNWRIVGWRNQPAVR